ncbi:MAG: hypothetical protein M1824_002307 [Vezdaea acicularis]|nr:MAG: hypothetical protein M1824_002307 [Vezdaea acicularis]
MARLRRAWTAPGRLEDLPYLELLGDLEEESCDDCDDDSLSSDTLSSAFWSEELPLPLAAIQDDSVDEGQLALPPSPTGLRGFIPTDVSFRMPPAAVQDNSMNEGAPVPLRSPTGLDALGRLKNTLGGQPPVSIRDNGAKPAVRLSSPVPVPPASPPVPPAPPPSPTGLGAFNPREISFRLPPAAVQDDNVTQELPALKTREVEVGVGGLNPRNVPFQLQPAPTGRRGFNPRNVPLRLPAPPLSAVGHGGFNPRDVPLRSPPAHIQDNKVNRAPPAPPPSPAGLGGFDLPTIPFRLHQAPAGRGGFNPLNVPLRGLLPALPPNPTGAGSFNPLNVPFRLPLTLINGDPTATPPTNSTFLDLYHDDNLPEPASKTLLTLAPPLPKTLAFSHRTQLEDCGAYEELLNGGYIIPEWSEEYYQAEQQQLAFYDGQLAWKRERQRLKEDAGATWWRVVDGREVREEGMPHAGLVREEPLRDGLRGVERRGALREGMLSKIVEEGSELDSHVNTAATTSSSAAAASLAANIRPGATPRTNRTNNANGVSTTATPATADHPPSPTPSKAETAWFHALFATLEEHDTSRPSSAHPTSRPGHIEFDLLGTENWVDDHSLTGLNRRLPRIRTPPPRLALLNEPQLAESLSAILTGETGTSLQLHPSSRIYQPGPAPDLEPPAPTTTARATSRHTAAAPTQPFAAAPVSAAPATKVPPPGGRIPPARKAGMAQPWSLAAFEAGRRDRKGRRGWGEGVVGFGNRALGKEWERDQVLRDWERKLVGQRRREKEMVVAAAAATAATATAKGEAGRLGNRGKGAVRRDITPGDEVRERVALLRARAQAEDVEREVFGGGREGGISGDSWASIR